MYTMILTDRETSDDIVEDTYWYDKIVLTFLLEFLSLKIYLMKNKNYLLR